MRQDIVFAKTALGRQVLSERSTRLSRSMRLALILVDGHSDINQLRLKAISIDNLEEELEQLALQGYICTDNPAWQPVTSSKEIGPIKAKLIDAAILVLGDEAEKITKALHETPDNLTDLKKTIERCKKIVDLTIDQSRATELKEICSRILKSEF